MKTRMHPSIILENIISSIWIIIAAGLYLLFNMFDDIDSKALGELAELATSVPFMGILIGIGVFIILLIIFTIYFFFRWYNTFVYLNEDSFNIESGRLFKKHTTMHLKDIAAVNIKQNILEKLLNTSNMKIVLNTNDENNFKGKLLFKTEKAKEIRNQILKKDQKEETFESLIDFQLADIVKHIFFSTNVLSLMVLLAVYVPIIYMFVIDFNTKNLIMAIIITVIFVFSIVWAIGKTFLNYYNFKLNREGDTIKITHGLLTTYKYELPIKKINAVMIKRTLQARIFGYYLVEVVNAGMNENEQEKTIITLYIKQNKLNFIFNKIIPEYQANLGLIKQPKKSLITYSISKIIWVILAIALIPITSYLSLLLIPFLVLIVWYQYKTKKIGINDDFLIFESGFFENSVAIIKLTKIELVSFQKGVFAHLTKLWSVTINIVGNLTNNSFRSGYFNKEVMKQIENVY